ncbi:MAG: hypothetical protein ACUVX8_04995 [Candidatus Zipacnadales bacterium]
MKALKQMDLWMLQEEQRALVETIERTTLGLTRGANWLISEFAPTGPIMRERDVSYCHKVTWGLFEDGRLEEAWRVLDWLEKNAKQGVAQYYFPEEPPFNREMQRVYRFLTFGKIAEALKYPGMANDETRETVCGYLHETGGCFGHPDDPELRQYLNPLVTAFFTEWALPAGLTEAAKKSGDFLVMMTELNRDHMDAEPGRFYYLYDPAVDKLVTEPPDGQAVNCYVDTMGTKQHFYYMGCSMAALADLYLAGLGEQYLDAAKVLAEFTERCNPEGLRWPSYCKVGWGAAELYLATGEPRHRIMSANCSDITFLSAQTRAGGWENMFYPVRDEGNWRTIVYDGRGLVPKRGELEEDGSWAWLSGHEITGEFLGEMGRTHKCFKAALGYVEQRIAQLATYD